MAEGSGLDVGRAKAAMQASANAQMEMQAASTRINGQIKMAEAINNTQKAAQNASTEQANFTAKSVSSNKPSQVIR